MRLLQSINIDQLLNLHLNNYLRQQNAQMLRQDCLSVRPIGPIIQMISIQLKADAEQDKTTLTATLQEEAYQSQLATDQNEASHDKRLATQYRLRKSEIYQHMESIKIQHENTEMAISHLSGRLQLLHDQLDDRKHSGTTHAHLTQRDRTQPALVDVHRHPTNSRSTVNSKINKNELLHAIENLNQEITNLRLTLRSHNNSTVLFKSELDTISEQEIRIRQREISRTERRRRPNHSIATLTKANREKLDRDIREKRTEIDSLRIQLENLASEKCHSTFLDILEHSLQNDLLIHIQNNENTALLSIISHMRKHVADLFMLENSQNALNKAQLNLTNQFAMRTAAELSTTRMDASSNLMRDENVRLNEANRLLNNVKVDFLNRRNQWAKYALIAGVLTAVTATLGFLLGMSATLIIPPLIPYILASFASVVTIGLLITSSIAWIKAAGTQSEINENSSKYNGNLNQIAKNSREIITLSKQQLPAIETAIPQYQQEIRTRQEQVKQATANARNSLTEAQEIEGISIFLPSVSQSGLGIFPVVNQNPQNHTVNPYLDVASMM